MIEISGASKQCSEPAIANGFCTAHVATGSNSSVLGARECIKMWQGRPSLAGAPYASDEAWRVLAEIDRIRQHGTSNSLIPRNVDSVVLAEMFFSPLFFDSPGRKERVCYWLGRK
jgi:hypothetical protein